MKLRTKYILFVVILHLLALVLSYFIFRENKVLFIASEIFILLSIWIAWSLYRQLLQPLRTLMEGVDVIKEKDFTVKFPLTGRYEMDELIKVFNQMMEQLKTERVRQEQQHFFLEKLIHTSPTGIIILNYDDEVQQINPKAMQLLGIEHTAQALSHPIFQQVLQLRSGESRTISLTGIATYKLQKSHFIDRGFPRHFVMIEELTVEILAAEKKVYEKVIRMMAHEVNNTIGPVNSIIQSTLKVHPLWTAPEHQVLRDALEVAIDRNQNLNVFMRNFAELVKLPEPDKKRIDLHQLLLAVTRLMQMKAAERDTQLVLALKPGTFMIMADEQQLEQALINIVKNSIESIANTGTITLSTREQQLIISDTGKGIAPADAEHIFSPFYSTKRDGQGIGLTLVREILMNHGWEFSLRTIGERDTQFQIRF
ncbi:sensor histidine kinase [Chitinophaga niabensis]|uniref:histidine kinase n=1 Tax=Chitinophaga niabensis TaxID=536979 RepID=A0A1N6EM94_9BACT|nr:ATP-binding protein [Chitinophaga niabensis]SIN84154.1 PAS domain-containing protein [Chitinophaga niabensis]